MTNDGGPAFPTEKMENGDYMLPIAQGGATVIKLQGMTLRDYFAAKAMSGHFSSSNAYSPSDLSDSYLQEIASSAYRVADAMLKIRG